MHPHPIPPHQKGKPWPAYFLVRTTGEVVPLIAVDELPLGTDLVGVPRSLDLEDTIGMLNLGLQRSSSAFYRILGAGIDGKRRESGGKVVLSKPTSEPPSSKAVPERTTVHSSTTPTTTPPSTPKAARTQAPSISPSTTTSQTNTTYHQTQIQLQPHPQTVLCRHWCHHGICKWGQQCRYRHIMPVSTSGLQEVGLSDWPVWFRRMNPGYFAAKNVASNSNVGGNGGRIGGGGGGCARGRRAGRERVTGCMSSGGNGGACCGVLHGPGGVGGPGSGVRERERGVRERERERVVSSATERAAGAGVGPGRGLRSEELGEQIIARLRGMSKEHATKEKDKAAQKASKRMGISSVVERATARETRNWEDESSDEETVVGAASESGNRVEEKEEGGKGKRKLVGV